MKRINTALCLIVIAMMLSPPSLAYAQKFTGDEVKAAFLYKLSKFIRWRTPRITYCFLGERGTMTETLRALLKKNQENSAVLSDIAIADINRCNLLFISSSSRSSLSDALLEASKFQVVTASDTDGFSYRGGMFTFSVNNARKIMIELNPDNAKKAGIDIKSELLPLITLTQ
jgi:hypothetical protein